MKVLAYNVLQTNRIKSITSSFLMLVSCSVIISSVWDALLPETYWQLGIAVVTIVVALLVQSLMDFEQVIEVKDRYSFMTYYRAGFLKFSRKLYAGPVDVLLEQDDKRYFCITVKTKAENIIIERIPTLKQANQRFEEIRAMFL
jgi:hypothetical protein